MLKVRVIPTLLWKGTGLVKGVGFDSWRRVGSVIPSLRIYNARDVDELLLLDITASRNGDEPDHTHLADFAGECSMPFTVGGGITALTQIASLLHSGADKIVINSAAVSNPLLVEHAAARFGSQCIVASIDVRKVSADGYEAFTHSGTRSTGLDCLAWARELAARGAGEILITSIERDGTMQGYDLGLVERVVKAVDIPVIASGGAGCYDHMVRVVKDAGASAVAAASMFHFTEQTPSGAKAAMHAAGIPVRTNSLK
jgi:cyclase